MHAASLVLASCWASCWMWTSGPTGASEVLVGFPPLPPEGAGRRAVVRVSTNLPNKGDNARVPLTSI
jgi:hypothetical protein